MHNEDINKSYVSEIDQFLYNFDAKHEQSLSQLKEILKYKRIAELRDNPYNQEQNTIWQDF